MTRTGATCSAPRSLGRGSRLAAVVSGSGPRLVLVHGFTQTGRSMEPLATALSGYELVRPDLPGHGRSPAPEGDLWSAASALGASFGTSAYLGYSLGGRVCLHLALLNPALVTRLVLVSTTAGIRDERGRDVRRRADEELASRLLEGGDATLPGFLEEWLQRPLFSTLERTTADMDSRLENSAAGLASSLRHHGTGLQAPLWDRLSELEMPVLVVAGSRDERFAAVGRAMADAIGSNARFALIDGAGHSVPLERPKELASLVAPFLAGG